MLFDPKREVIVQLNEHDSNYGPNKEELRPLYNGRWLHPLNDNFQNDSFNLKESEPQVNELGKLVNFTFVFRFFLTKKFQRNKYRATYKTLP